MEEDREGQRKTERDRERLRRKKEDRGGWRKTEEDKEGQRRRKEDGGGQRRTEKDRESEQLCRQDSLFTPFLPLRSFLYCSLSCAISPWSTSQAISPTGVWSSFSTRQQENEKKEERTKVL